MRRLVEAGLVLALVAILVAGCGSASAAFPTGKWTATNTSGEVALMEYRADGTWTISGGTSLADVQEIDSGTYVADRGGIYFSADTYCKGMGAEQATYSWTHEAGRLTFKVLKDGCLDRVGTLDGTTFTPVQ